MLHLLYPAVRESDGEKNRDTGATVPFFSSEFAFFEVQNEGILPTLTAVSLPYTDLQGRTIQLWKFQNILIASLEEDGKTSFLDGKRVYNALQPDENGSTLLLRIEKAGLQLWPLERRRWDGLRLSPSALKG